jgi:hypothetical protein
MTDLVESELARLPEPMPPATLAATVMARVAEERAPSSLASRAPRDNSANGRARRSWTGLPAWAAAFAGLAIVFVSWIGGQLEAGSSLALISSQIGVPSPGSMPPNGSAVFGLALGLLLYLAGLFAPLRKSGR